MIGTIPYLKRLNIANNQIQDISALAKHPTLMILDMSGNKIVDLSPIANKALMKNLILAGNEVVDVTPLGTLRVLKHLDLSRNRIEDLSPLLKFENAGMKLFAAEGNPIIKDDTHCPVAGGSYLMRLFCNAYLK